MSRRVRSFLFLVLVCPALAFAKQGMHQAPAVPADAQAKELAAIGITENLGRSINLDLKFRTEGGELKSLREIVSGKKPLIVSLVYFSCPNLCNFHLNGLNDGLRQLEWTAGKEYEVVAVSIDPRETPEVAMAKKQNYLAAYGRPEGERGWHFLTGTQESITQLAEQVGFKYRWDEATKEWAHSSAAVMATPAGVISRYLHGVQFAAKDLKLALLESAQGKVGTWMDQVIFYCFKYSPQENKYVLYAYNVMRAGAAMTVVLLMGFLAPVWLRQRKSAQEDGKNA